MSRPSRSTPAAMTAAPLVLVVAGTRHSAAAPVQGMKFLGFEIGEERRYVLGPDEIAERGIWSIRLDEVFETSGDPEGMFAISHEWNAAPSIADPVLGQIRAVKSEGYVRVNGHGFPLFIQYRTQRHLAGMGDEAYTIDYTLDEDRRRFQKRTTSEGERWYQDVPIRDHDGVDRRAPAGLFAFLPAPPGCLDAWVQRSDQLAGTTMSPRPTNSPAGGQVVPPRMLKVTDNSGCPESMFAHPGMLSLAMPALWEAEGERDYLFFTPVGAVGRSTTGVGFGAGNGPTPNGPGSIVTQPGAVGRGMMPPSPMSRLEGDPLSSASYHRTETLKFVERRSVRVGSRSTDAWVIEVSGGYGPIYVDDDGGVLRIDLPAASGASERWIRRLWPSEF